MNQRHTSPASAMFLRRAIEGPLTARRTIDIFYRRAPSTRRRCGARVLCLTLLASSCLAVPTGWTQVPESVTTSSVELKEEPKRPLPIELGKNWIRATKDYEVWIDFKQKQVLVGGSVCLREGMLEMFACPQGTKEHESVVAVNTPARFVHGALVAIGAKPGPPVQFEPQYQPAQGTPIEVTVVWKDSEGKEQRSRAQEWVKRTETGKALDYPWVFAGSGYWTDTAAGDRFYYADGGEFICVSNFSTAMLDLPVASSDTNDSLMFSAFTERIPPRGTRVCLILAPQAQAKEGTSPVVSTLEKKEVAAPLAPPDAASKKEGEQEPAPK